MPPKKKAKADLVTMPVEKMFVSAGYEGDVSKLNELLKSGGVGVLNACDEEGRTALYSAVCSRKRDAVQWLLEQKADVNAAILKGSTPLHRAAFDGSEDLVKLLLKFGASVDVVNKHGLTCVDEAKGPTIKQLLLAAKSPQAPPAAAAAAPPAAAESAHECDASRSAFVEAALRFEPAPLLTVGTESPESGLGVQREPLSDADILGVLRAFVPGVDALLDRKGETPVTALITSTYREGLPLYAECDSLQQQIIHALRFLMHRAAQLQADPTPSPERRAVGAALSALCDAYGSCQAEQARAILLLFARISGKERTFPQQVGALLVELKGRALEQTVVKLHPTALTATDETPDEQAAHIESAYRAEWGALVGLGASVDAARLDACAPELSERELDDGLTTFEQVFAEPHGAADQLIDALVRACSASPTAGAETEAEPIERSKITEWAMKGVDEASAAASGFDRNCIFYDDEHSEWYGSSKPAEGAEYEPFLCRRTATALLTYLFAAAG